MMKIEVTSHFKSKLRNQLEFIALDKKGAARKFNKTVFEKIRKLAKYPKQNRKSIFFENDNIRDLVVHGYVIVYEILPNENKIVVFGFYKWQENL